MNENQFKESFAENRDRYMGEWETFLSFAGISADPAHDDDCRENAEWLCAHLVGLGMEAELLETCNKPCVYGRYIKDPALPTVLYYGHYDVQPVDPLDGWTTPPFEPTWRNGRLYARGAEDNKGQVFYVLKAVENLIRTNQMAVNLIVLIEGEEEYGSEGITDALPKWADRIQADVLLVTDTNTVASGAPTIVMGLRGIIHLTVELRGPNRDLHSGLHGGKALNPAKAMMDLAASLHHADGSIAVEGYYDDVAPVSEEDLAAAQAHPIDPAEYLNTTGVLPNGGEVDRSIAERVGFRPTLEINGIHSGYGGAGMKTIIPSMAVLKLSSRLVAGQDPQTCLDQIIQHLESHAHPDLALTIEDAGVGGAALRLNASSPLADKARKVMNIISDQKPVLLWEGASIPILTLLAEVSGSEPLLAGFGSDDGNAHAPDESFSEEQFRTGYLYASHLLSGGLAGYPDE